MIDDRCPRCGDKAIFCQEKCETATVLAERWCRSIGHDPTRKGIGHVYVRCERHKRRSRKEAEP